MSFVAPTRRLALSVPNLYLPTALIQARTKSSWSLSSLNPFASNKSTNSAPTADGLDDPAVRKALFQQTFAPKIEGSIFEDEIKSANQDKPESPTSQPLDPSAQIPGRDPDPRGRLRFERRKVVQMVLKHGAETQADIIARTERTMTYKSPLLPTSTKKLMYLAQQISGKSLDEAMLQMGYSKKKMGTEIKMQLENAKNRAVVVHGMGLGKFNGESEGIKPRTIEDKDGKFRTIADPTSMYIEQAWVNKGAKRYKRAIHLGRGRRVPIRSHQATISVVLKEEKTRMRVADEKKAKKKRNSPWIHLPHRPISQQHQYYLW